MLKKLLKKPRHLEVDKITNEMIKYGGQNIQEITNLFQRIMRTGTIPHEWKTTISIPIYKKRKNNLIPVDYWADFQNDGRIVGQYYKRQNNNNQQKTQDIKEEEEEKINPRIERKSWKKKLFFSVWSSKKLDFDSTWLDVELVDLDLIYS